MEKKGKMQEQDTDFYADTMEQEKVLRSFSDLNYEKGIFVNAFAGGLNREKGIFDQKAIFVSKQEKENE